MDKDALLDFSRAIELMPEFSEAYTNRGELLSGMGSYNDAVVDLKTAARLGNKHAQNLLKSKSIEW
jgi:tetratricopeptide (TPR) repeat protein